MKRGFTLIELLVVISIISLLSTTVLASLNSARTKASASYTQQQLHQYGAALQEYVLDYGHFPDPSAANNNSDHALYCIGSVTQCASSGYSQSTKLNNEFTKEIPSLPDINYRSSSAYIGLLYQCEIVGPATCITAKIYFVVEGIQSCKAVMPGNLLIANNVGNPASIAVSGNTLCVVRISSQ